MDRVGASVPRMGAVADSSPGARFVLRILLPLLALNALLTFGNDWPGFGVRAELLLSVELCLGATLLLAWVRRWGVPSSRMLTTLALVLVVLVIARYIEVTVPAVFGRPLNLYWDGRHAWQVLRMAAIELAPWRIAGTGLALAVGGVLLFCLLRILLGVLARGFAASGGHRWMLGIGLALVLAHGAQPWLMPEVRAAFAIPVTSSMIKAGGQLRDALSARRDDRLGPGPVFAGTVEALHGSDVLLIFAEAYGAVSYDDAGIAAALADSRAALLHSLAERGRGVVSASVRSPTFGGGSWLAHAALLSGIDTRDPGNYELLLSTDRPTLVRHFARNGYRTVAWMPGLQRPWPEGQFYGFERYADADGIGYRGPAFGYWRIPDQAALALLQAQELDRDRARTAPEPNAGVEMAADRRPRFIVFPTVSSHAPFRPVPPYVENWGELLQGGGFSAQQLAAALAEPVSWGAPRPAYLQAMRYTFAWLSGYLREHAPDDLLIIVIGDHQPIGGVSGREASWEVPVHVIGADPALLARFEAAGFQAGIEARPPLLGDMHMLTSVLVEVFAASEGER